MKYIIKIGKLYLDSISLENYDLDFRISLTSLLMDAKKIDEEKIEYITSILISLDIDHTVDIYNERSDIDVKTNHDDLEK